MGVPPDEHLPEVVPDHSPQTVPDGFPQAVPYHEIYMHQRAFEGIPKYSASYDTSPKYSDFPILPAGLPAGLESAYYYDYQTRDPHSGVPWEPISAIDGLPAGTVVEGSGTGTSTYFMSESEKPLPTPAADERIFGLRKRTFYIVLGVTLFLLAAAVGAGVGGGLAANNNRVSSAANLTPTPTTNGNAASGGQDSGGQANGGGGGQAGGSATPTESIPPEPTTTLRDPTLNETRPDLPYEFQAWSGPNFTGEVTPIYKKHGYYDLPFAALSYVWNPNGWTCCVSFCQNLTDTSGNYWCAYRRQPKASSFFTRIYAQCGTDAITHKAVACS